MERDAVLLQDGLKHLVKRWVISTRHVREQMVLNLVVEVTSEEIEPALNILVLGDDVLGGIARGVNPVLILRATNDGEHVVVKGEDPTKVSSGGQKNKQVP